MKYEKCSTNWISKSLYFYDSNQRGYPFKELSIDWLYQYHTCYQQFALEVIKLLTKYDAVITPFYWVRKIQRQKVKDDNTFIIQNARELIEGTINIDSRIRELESYIEEFEKIKNENI